MKGRNGLLVGALLICASPVAAFAQSKSESAEQAELEPVTVTGSRIPQQLSDLPISATVIREAELSQQLGVTSSVLETLDALVPGLTPSQEEFRSGCRSNIRGRAAQFLINGVPTNDNLRASTCGSLFNLSPFAIESIEVVRGATAVYGAGAPGGIINLMTRKARSQTAEIDAIAQWGVNPHAWGGSTEQNLYAGVGQAFAHSDYYIGLGLQEYNLRHNPDGGVVQGETFGATSLNAAAGWDVGPGTLRVTGLFHERDPEDAYGTDFTQVSGSQLAPSAFSAQPPNPYANQAKTTQSLLTLSYDLAAIAGHSLNVSTYWHDERLIQRAADYFDDGDPATSNVFYFDSDAENQRLGLRTALSRDFASDMGTLTATYGLDLLRQRYYRPEVDPATGAVLSFISPEVILESAALFMQPQFRTGAWLFNAGVRHERYQGEVGSEGYDPALGGAGRPGDTPDFDLTLFNAGVVYDLTETAQLFAGFSQGAEISEFGRAARNSNDASLINLDAAASNQYEIGWRGATGRTGFSVAAFYSDSDKAASLQADPSCAGDPICPLIPLRLSQELYGLEGTLDWKASDRLGAGAIFTYQKGERQEPGSPPVAAGTDQLSPPRAVAYVEVAPLADWHNRLQASYSAETDEYSANEEAAGFRDAESVFLVDLTSSYPVGAGTLSLGVANLLNERYVNATNSASGDFFYYLSEGTRATLTYKLRF